LSFQGNIVKQLWFFSGASLASDAAQQPLEQKNADGREILNGGAQAQKKCQEKPKLHRGISEFRSMGRSKKEQGLKSHFQRLTDTP
jgi:hypothetical protein